MSFLARRILASVLQIAAASVLAFLLFTVAPGDFYSAERFDPRTDAGRIEQLRAERGLRDAWLRRYAAWIASCARGEFGTSMAYGMPVGRLLVPRAQATGQVAVPAFLLAWMAGLGLALRWPRLTAGAASVALAPDVIVVSLLLWIAVRFGLPITGAALPVSGLTAALLPVIYLHAAGGLETARNLPFVRMAAQRGVTGARLWRRYILPAAVNPLVSLFGLTVASAVGSSLVVEALTGWPGLGPLFLEAVQARDYPVVQAVLFLLAALLAGANLLVDLVLYRLDPRIRTPR